jgi:hypothetical protein
MMKLRPHTLLTAITVVALAASGASFAAPTSLHPRDEANLVVSRFLVAAALGDRTTACSLFPSYGACMRTAALRGSAEFRVTGIALSGSGRALVTAVVGGSTGYFKLERSGAGLVIRGASFATTPHADASTRARGAASLVVSRFLVAAALGDARTACALYPSYFPCAQHAPVVSSAAFRLIDVSLADPTRPAVFANIDGLRGYFVLERQGRRSYVISSAALD